MKASDLFVKALENEGVEYIFGPKCTAPGLSSSAKRKASRTKEGIILPLTICLLDLVSGSIMRTISII
jgi:hypothetical protein